MSRYTSIHRQGLMEGRRANGTAVYVSPPTRAEAERDERETRPRDASGVILPVDRAEFGPFPGGNHDSNPF